MMEALNSWAFSVFGVAVILCILNMLMPGKKKDGAVVFIMGLILVVAVYYPVLRGIEYLPSVTLPEISFSSDEIKKAGEESFFQKYSEVVKKNLEADLAAYFKEQQGEEILSTEVFVTGSLEEGAVIGGIEMTFASELSDERISELSNAICERYGVQNIKIYREAGEKDEVFEEDQK